MISQLESRVAALRTAAGHGLRSAWMALAGEDPELIGTLRAYPRGAAVNAGGAARARASDAADRAGEDARGASGARADGGAGEDPRGASGARADGGAGENAHRAGEDPNNTGEGKKRPGTANGRRNPLRTTR
jgi:hypothetical protein